MSIANYTLPIAAPPPVAYLGPLHQASAINSLLYDTPRYGERTSPSVSSSPSRRQQLYPRKNKDVRDPYRNQRPSPKTRYQTSSRQTPNKNANDYDEYINDQDYDSGENYDKNTSESELGDGTPSSKDKVRKVHFQTVHQVQESSRQQQQQRQQQQNQGWPPNHPPTYKRIANTFNSVSEPGAKTSLHAVIDFDDDFDDDDYSYEDDDLQPVTPSRQTTPIPEVTPIEGPIFIKNGSVPVVPLYSYPIVNNGTLVQIPILWTALSLALGFEIHGEIVRGVPCIKRFHQLFCPTAGNTYPIERIERFIDDNKALMKRMYGEFQMSTEYASPLRETYQGRRTVKRQARGDGSDNSSGGPNSQTKPDSYFGSNRSSRESFKNSQNDNSRVDACESKIEIVTPYWASNSAGKIRAIVNTQHFEQAIHQEVCSKVQTKRCIGDCGCEQKYKWHRLLAYDPDNDCKGIFMDWFLFPSCCVCRCAPIFGN